MTRVLFVALALASVAFVSCGGDGGQANAFKATLTAFGDDPAAAPLLGQDYDCLITVGEVPPTPAPTIPPVAGTCRWDMDQIGDSWHAVFRETWACRDFQRNVPPYAACNTATGTHRWEFLVDKALKVSALPDSGNFAPDMRR